MSTLTQIATEFPAVQAMRHRMREDGRESLAHMLMFPEHGIAGFIYPTVLTNGHAKGRACLFGPALDQPVQEEIDGRVGESLDFDDWRTGPLRMAVVRPHHTVDLSWRGERIRFDGRFEARHPPYAFSMHPLGNPPYYGDDRTEQHGRVTCELDVDGRLIETEGWLIRDHSWGPRIWGLNQHYKWFHAITGSTSVHFFEMHSFGRIQLRGFLYRDGVMEHLARVDCDFTFDTQMMHQTVRATVVDTAGRRAIIDGKVFASIQLDFDPMILLNDAAITVDLDGETGTGWCEFCWNRNYLEFARKHVRTYG